jgi:copper chaperone CopZ
MKTLRLFFPLILLLLSMQAKAQFKSADLYVSGLTCSMCSYATEKSLRTLDFIADVQPDLNSNLFVLTFKKDKPVSIDMIQKKVKAAGFSVYKLSAVFAFNDVNIKDGYHFQYQGDLYQFMNVPAKKLQGDVKVTFLDKGFVPEPEFRKLAKSTTYKCYRSGRVESCCNEKNAGERVYHVTL